MADYRIYEDNLGQYARPEQNYLTAKDARKVVEGGVSAASVAGDIEAKLRQELRGMTQTAVDHVCRRLRQSIAAAAAQALELHVKRNIPKQKAVWMAVRALMHVTYDPKYKGLWK